MLDEQWRMAEPIGSAVSSLFYEPKLKLRVAEPAAEDLEWKAERTVKATRLLPANNLILIETGAVPEAPKQFNFKGYECSQSARLIAALVVDHVVHWRIEDEKEELLVLTPFRAQRRKIEEELRSIQVPVSLVSTVHRVQGSERKIVIFDPVCPTSDFVSGKGGKLLINVALSRAKCRLIVLLQQGWEKNDDLLKLSGHSAPIRLDQDEIDRLLLSKLGRGYSPNPKPPKPVIPLVKNSPRSLMEEFREELAKRGAQGKTRRDVERLIRELKDKAKFRKVSYADIDLMVKEFSASERNT